MHPVGALDLCRIPFTTSTHLVTERRLLPVPRCGTVGKRNALNIEGPQRLTCQRCRTWLAHELTVPGAFDHTRIGQAVTWLLGWRFNPAGVLPGDSGAMDTATYTDPDGTVWVIAMGASGRYWLAQHARALPLEVAP